jgi:hypothetical protein
MEGKRGQLRTMPLTIVQKHIERLTAKGQNLCTQVKFALSGSTTTLTRLKGRFDKNRFIKRLVKRFSAAIKLTSMQLDTQFIGEIIDVKGDTQVIGEDGNFDIMKIHPLIFDTSHKGYHGVGPCLGQAFSVGKNFQK